MRSGCSGSEARFSVTNERGYALLLAIFALVMMGAFVTGAFFVGRVEQQIGRGTVYFEQASAAAEAGLIDAASRDPATLDALPIYTGSTSQIAVFPTKTVAGHASLQYTDSVFRLNPVLFLIQSSGTRFDAAGQVLATKTLGTFARIDKPVDRAPTVRPLSQRAWVQIY